MEAFCYSWTDWANNRLYVGWHKGCPTDGYICSNKLLLEQIKERPSDFTRQIIAQGTAEDMFSLESAILRSVDAASDPQFYNQSNNFNRGFNGLVKGSVWWTDGKRGKRSKDCPGPGWYRGKPHTYNPAGAQKRVGIPRSTQTKQKLSEWRKLHQHGEFNPNRKGIVVDGVPYATRKQASAATGISTHMLNRMIELRDERVKNG